MGIGPENPWWQDVAALGPDSPGAAVFDIDWQANAGGTPGRSLPTLGTPYGVALAAGELRITLDGDAGP